MRTLYDYENAKSRLPLLPGLNQECALLGRMQARFFGLDPPPSLIRFGLRIIGAVDVGRLRSTLNEIARQHAGLRIALLDDPAVDKRERERRLAVFARVGIVDRGLVMQLLLQVGEVRLQELDFSGYERGAQVAAVHRWIENEDLQPFDQHRPPLIRAGLFRFSGSEHLLIVFTDHLVSDGSSIRILRQEIRRLYGVVHSNGSRNSELLRSRVSFPDFVVWQNRAFETSYFDDDLRYWRDQWARFGSARVSFGDLPFTLSPPKKPNFVFASLDEQLTELDSGRVRALARQAGVTLFAVFLAALAAVLRKYTGKSMLAIWGHLANRASTDRLEIVGYLANTHIFGLDLSNNPTAQELVRQAHVVILEAVGHQELPLPHLWRTLRCAPRFPQPVVLIDFYNIPKSMTDTQAFPEMMPVVLPPSRSPRLASFGIYVTDDSRQTSVNARYATSRFSDAAVRDFLAALCATVLAMAGKPDAKVSEVAQLPADTRESRRRAGGEMGEFVLLDSDRIPSVPFDVP